MEFHLFHKSLRPFLGEVVERQQSIKLYLHLYCQILITPQVPFVQPLATPNSQQQATAPHPSTLC